MGVEGEEEGGFSLVVKIFSMKVGCLKLKATEIFSWGINSFLLIRSNLAHSFR